MRDKGRDMYARYGLRLYAVRIVRVRAVGGRKRGDGADEVVNAWEILPVPTVADLSTLTVIVTPAQMREAGSLVLSGISGAYSEYQLSGRGPDGSAVPAGESVFWEIAFQDPRGRASARRRMIPDSAPSYDPSQAAWSVVLRRQYDGRNHDGTVRDGGT